MDEQRQDDQLERIYNSYVLVQGIALKTSREQWTIETGGERGSGRSVLAARYDNDDSGLTLLYFLKHKSNTLLATKKYLAGVAPYGYVKCLRTDNGTVFTSEPFQRLLVLNRTKHNQSACYFPH